MKQVFLITLDGNTRVLRVSDQCTATELHAMVYVHEAVPVEHQSLTVGGRPVPSVVVEDDAPLVLRDLDVVRMSLRLPGSAFGTCIGSVGIGSCGSSSSSQSINLSNTAIARAFMSNAFNCTSTTNAGNTVKVAGTCACSQVGIFNTIDCQRWQAQNRSAALERCKLLSKRKDITDKTLLCACAQGGCAEDVNQDSYMSNESKCELRSDARQRLKQNFANDVLANVKSQSSDVGALLDTGKQKSIVNLATQLENEFTNKVVSNVSQNIDASNRVDVGCGGVAVGITQSSHFTNVLNVLSKTTSFQDIAQKMSNTIKSTISRKNQGFLGGLFGWLKSTGGIIMLVIIGIVGIVLIWFFVVHKKK